MRLKDFLNEKDIMAADEIYTKEEITMKKLGYVQWKKLDNDYYEVWGNFNGNPNKMPIKIKIFHGNFHCMYDYGEEPSLNGSPEIIFGNYFCSNLSQLSSLEGGPREIYNGIYDCSNSHLKSLKGLPKIIEGNFDCSKNDIVSLEKFPEEINGNLSISFNLNLKSLKGAPKVVKGRFDCSWCGLTTLENGPKIVDGNYICSHNLKKFTKENVESICRVGEKIFV